MDNVYDLVAGFYGHDAGWNFLLRREYAEGFLRTEAWRGTSQDELYDVWDQLTMLCLYLGNTELLLGDMNAGDFVDCVAWCGRNVSEFEPDYEHTKYFLDTCSRLFDYLVKKNAISWADAPAEAAAKLLAGGKMNIINPDGSFDAKYAALNRASVPDASSKIFLNVSERMREIYAAVQDFFTESCFSIDLERASVLYHGIFAGNLAEPARNKEEAFHSFWDYFLLDYKLRLRDMHPLEYFYRTVCCETGSHYDAEFAKRNSDILQELIKAQLIMFTVEGATEDGAYYCRSFLTGESLILPLPLDDDFDTTDMLFIGHIFYNGSMLTDNVRGYKTTRISRVFLNDMLTRAYNWVVVQQAKPSWGWFVDCFPMAVRSMAFLYAAGMPHRYFNNYTEHTDYKAEPYNEESVTAYCLKNVMLKNYFALADVRLATQMWCDLQAAEGFDRTRFNDREWAAGIIYAFVKLNGAYTFFDENIAEFCNTQLAVMQNAAQAAVQLLNIEDHDPRYTNEEGLLVMLMSAHK